MIIMAKMMIILDGISAATKITKIFITAEKKYYPRGEWKRARKRILPSGPHLCHKMSVIKRKIKDSKRHIAPECLIRQSISSNSTKNRNEFEHTDEKK